MDRDKPRRQAGFNSRQLRTSDPIGSRPDRIALWAFVLAVVVLVAAAGTARAGSGGIDAGAKGASTGGATAEAPNGRSQASFFGPGLYGNEMACGKRLTRTVVGVAHRALPCGTEVTFRYEGRTLRTTVVDRGPFVDRITWDLTSAAASKLGLTFTDTVRSTLSR